ncbi:MAG: hypothetical protein JNM34_12835 [Chthonomonadaceae bacterium]|nr:hypothetical protein [Chthonomonadaceae bacterium]
MSVNVGSRVRKSIETALQENSERLAAKRVKLEDIIARGSLGRYSDASSAFIAVRKAYDDAVVQAAIAKGRLEAAKAGVGAVLNRADGSTALGASSAGSGGGGISDEGLKTLSDELQKRRLALLDAASEFQPDTPEYRNAKRELDNAQRVIRQSVEEQRNALKKGLNPALIQAQAELAGLERSVVAAGKLVRDYQNKVADTPKTEESFGEYQALIDVRTMLTKELERAKLNESSDPSRFEVLDPPSSDTKPESPRPLLLSAIAFVAVAAVMIAFEAALRQRRA